MRFAYGSREEAFMRDTEIVVAIAVSPATF